MGYKPCLVTFFDILGFKHLIKRKDADSISEILKKLRNEATPDPHQREKFEIDVVAFSDNVVRSVHILGESNLQFSSGLLWNELFSLAFIQGLMIYEDGVFLRGGMTANHHFFEDNIVFGPGLVQAYNIEHGIAKYPRIIVDDAILQLVQEYPRLFIAAHHDLATEREYLNEYLLVDTDGKTFINYLGPSHIDTGDGSDMMNVMVRHYERVIDAAKANAGDECVLEKYRWVASYHNRIVNGYSDNFFHGFECDKVDLVLTNNDVPGVEGWSIAEK